MIQRTFLALALLGVCLTAQAQEPILFNGGISLEERESAPLRGTRLEFFVSSGAYLSDVHVIVTDADGGTVVDAVTNGPWLILDLPDGTYDVNVSVDGESHSGRFTTDGTFRSYGYRFSE